MNVSFGSHDSRDELSSQLPLSIRKGSPALLCQQSFNFAEGFAAKIVIAPQFRSQRFSPVLFFPWYFLENRKPGNHPNFEKNALGVKRPFSEQFSEFRGILGATLGMALTT